MLAIPRADLGESSDAPGGVSTTYGLGLGQTFEGSIGQPGDTDWLRVSLEAGRTYVLNAWGTGGGLDDPRLTLYDAQGRQLAYNDDAPGSNPFSLITYTPAASGTYYVAAGGSGTGAYRLRLATDVFTLDQIATHLTEIAWGYPMPYRFDAGPGSTLTVNLSGLTAEGRQLARWALDLWTQASGLAFAETTGAARITFDDEAPGASAGPTYNPLTGVIQSSYVNVSKDWLTAYGTTIDSHSMNTYLHEIGHALGLGHAGFYDGQADYGTDNYYRNDTRLLTVMSYFGPEENGYIPAAGNAVVTPMPADVAAIHRLYGGTVAAEGGDTVWGAGSNVPGVLGQLMGILFDGRPADPAFYDGGPVSLTLVDPGGRDLLDLSTRAEAARVDLTPGSFSDFGGGRNNLALSSDTVIENLRTGAGSDQVRGNAVANRIDSGAGNDSILAGAGNDTLLGRAGNDTLSGEAGNDLIAAGGVQGIHFAATAAQVYRLYEATLDRRPAMAGLDDWTERLALGTSSLTEVAQGFVNSPEFRQTYGALDDTGFVTLLFRNVLGREPGPGLAAWVDELASGRMSRAEVVLGFSQSAEFTLGTAAAASAFIAAADPAAWAGTVYRLFQATLDREPALAGLSNWAGSLANGSSLTEVARGFVDSPEFRQTYGALDDTGFVTLLFRNVLGREPGPGLAAWVDELASGRMSRAEVVLGFSQSAEFTRGTGPDLVAFMQRAGGDRIEGGAGDDLLLGGFGSDTFVFAPGTAGETDRVRGLDDWDRLDLSGFGYGSAAEALSHFSQSGGDTLFQDQGLAVIFEGTTLTRIGERMIALDLVA